MADRYDVRDENGCSYYILVKDTDKGQLFELYTGYDGGWLEKDKLLASILNSGNGFSFKFPDKVKPNFNEIDFSLAENLRILLNFENIIDHKPLNYSVSKESFKI